MRDQQFGIALREVLERIKGLIGHCNDREVEKLLRDAQAAMVAAVWIDKTAKDEK